MIPGGVAAIKLWPETLDLNAINVGLSPVFTFGFPVVDAKDK